MDANGPVSTDSGTDQDIAYSLSVVGAKNCDLIGESGQTQSVCAKLNPNGKHVRVVASALAALSEYIPASNSVLSALHRPVRQHSVWTAWIL